MIMSILKTTRAIYLFKPYTFPYRMPSNENLKWKAFVDSIKSKMTVKQVVDGVRAGGALSFDYLLLIVTADSLAALGLVENNAPNITAAMLVSPLMGPVMSITFGTIISDRELVVCLIDKIYLRVLKKILCVLIESRFHLVGSWNVYKLPFWVYFWSYIGHD